MRGVWVSVCYHIFAIVALYFPSKKCKQRQHFTRVEWIFFSPFSSTLQTWKHIPTHASHNGPYSYQYCIYMNMNPNNNNKYLRYLKKKVHISSQRMIFGMKECEEKRWMKRNHQIRLIFHSMRCPWGREQWRNIEKVIETAATTIADYEKSARQNAIMWHLFWKYSTIFPLAVSLRMATLGEFRFFRKFQFDRALESFNLKINGSEDHSFHFRVAKVNRPETFTRNLNEASDLKIRKRKEIEKKISATLEMEAAESVFLSHWWCGALWNECFYSEEDVFHSNMFFSSPLPPLLDLSPSERVHLPLMARICVYANHFFYYSYYHHSIRRMKKAKNEKKNKFTRACNHSATWAYRWKFVQIRLCHDKQNDEKTLRFPFFLFPFCLKSRAIAREEKKCGNQNRKENKNKK